MQDVAECTIVKKVTLGVTIVLLLTNAYITTITAFAAPVLGNMAKAFPNAGAQIGLVMSLPALVMIPAIIIAGYLSSYLSKKTILMIGSIIFLIGGVALVFYDNMTYILITRAVCGFGAGLVFPMTPALIAQLFGRDQVPKMIGWMYTAGSVFSVVLGLAAGYLGVVNWHFAFDVVWIFVIMIILQQILLPKVPPEKQDAAIKEEKASLNVFAWAFIVLNFLYMCIGMITVLEVSIFIFSAHLGNSAQAGIANTATTLVCLLLNLVFGQIFRVLDRYSITAGFIAVGLCFLCFSAAHSIAVVYLGSALMGLSMVLVLSATPTCTAKVLTRATQTKAISFVCTAQYIGFFVATFVIQFLLKLSHGAIRPAFLSCFIIGVVIAIITVIFNVATNKQVKELYQNCGTPSEAAV